MKRRPRISRPLTESKRSKGKHLEIENNFYNEEESRSAMLRLIFSLAIFERSGESLCRTALYEHLSRQAG
jgi:hypothetical protein